MNTYFFEKTTSAHEKGLLHVIPAIHADNFKKERKVKKIRFSTAKKICPLFASLYKTELKFDTLALFTIYKD